MQGLQHQAVAAERDDGVGGLERGIAVAGDEARLGLEGLGGENAIRRKLRRAGDIESEQGGLAGGRPWTKRRLLARGGQGKG
jgi:hypothetical protein